MWWCFMFFLKRKLNSDQCQLFHSSGDYLPSFAVKVSLEGKHGFCNKTEGNQILNGMSLVQQAFIFLYFCEPVYIQN